jgi:hypothetical protein
MQLWTATSGILGSHHLWHRRATDPSKIIDIIKWKTPKTLKKLRGFLGITGYYRRFIQGYATICQPLYLALKKTIFSGDLVNRKLLTS